MENEVRLIDENVLYGMLEWDNDIERYTLRGLEFGDEIPTIDPETLRPKGRWFDEYWDDQWQVMTASCSNCHDRGEVRVRRNENGKMVIDSPACPTCGAKMEVEADGN